MATETLRSEADIQPNSSTGDKKNGERKKVVSFSEAGLPSHQSPARPASPTTPSQRSPSSGCRKAVADSSNIKVCVRVRPFSAKEKSNDEKLCVSMPTLQDVFISGESDEQSAFQFDRAYWSHDPLDSTFATQQTLMEEIGHTMVQNSLEGFNNCLFAYGQTGSGKTYSVLGDNSSSDHRGLLPRIVHELFSYVTKDDECYVSYLEVYNEQVRDLLAPPSNSSSRLKVLEHPKLGVVVPGLSREPATSYAQVEKVIDFGAKSRAVAATSMNDVSSRSHCVFTFELVISRTDADGTRSRLRSKLNLVDLAGSERAKKTEAAGDRLKEGSAINVSLTVLSRVVAALAKAAQQGGKSKEHVPFRESRLTYLLSPSLSGNSKTAMVAALSPALSNYDETLGTLRFAKEVKSIKCNAVKNLDKKADLVAQLQREIESLQEQMKKSSSNIDPDTLAIIEDYEALKNQYGKDFGEIVEASKKAAAFRQEALADMGLTSAELAQSVDIDESCPQLRNLSDDASLSGCLVYFLPQGEETTIGADVAQCKIKLSGIGLKPRMCCIFNEDNVSLTLEPHEGRVLLNGHALHGQQQLTHHDRLILGHAYCFRIFIPKAACEERTDQHTGAMQFAEAMSEILPDTDSAEYQECCAYAQELSSRIGPVKAELFRTELCKLVPLIDEANEITKEIKPTSRLKLRLEVSTDLYSYQSAKPDFVVRVVQAASDGARIRDALRRRTSVTNKWTSTLGQCFPRLGIGDTQPAVVATWDVAEFKLRLTYMREVYRAFHGQGSSRSSDWYQFELGKPENNPWLQIMPWDIAEHASTERCSGNQATFTEVDSRESEPKDLQTQVRELRGDVLRQQEELASQALKISARDDRIKALQAEVQRLHGNPTASISDVCKCSSGSTNGSNGVIAQRKDTMIYKVPYASMILDASSPSDAAAQLASMSIEDIRNWGQALREGLQDERAVSDARKT